MGYVKNEAGVTSDWLQNGTWEVELAWRKYAAKVQLSGFYDPKGERIKA
jgi:glycine cleavage system aminomethyltransferase T